MHQKTSNIIQDMASDLWGSANIHFLSLFKMYDNYTCAVIPGHQAWTDYFIKHHFTHENMYSRNAIGLHRWQQAKSRDLVKAAHHASMHFHITGLLDVVKLSMHEVGCYDIYTFGVDRCNSVYVDDVYKKHHQQLLSFIPQFEAQAKKIILEQSHPDNRITIKFRKFVDRYSHAEYWGENWEHINSRLGNEAHLFPAKFPVRD